MKCPILNSYLIKRTRVLHYIKDRLRRFQTCKKTENFITSALTIRQKSSSPKFKSSPPPPRREDEICSVFQYLPPARSGVDPARRPKTSPTARRSPERRFRPTFWRYKQPLRHASLPIALAQRRHEVNRAKVRAPSVPMRRTLTRETRG